MDINNIIEDFIKVCKLANVELSKLDITIEILESGEAHIPSQLPRESMAVYIFMDKNNDICLKVGKVGGNSNARYQSQHYNPESSQSNLAKSILNDPAYNIDSDSRKNIGHWIRQNTKRINLKLHSDKGIPTINLLEAFLQIRLNPKYEGFKSQNQHSHITAQL